ncbi:MAG: nucleotidyltransferase [Promethearchaeota archaeon CR_4]|nr:MAG: nucleotidyltransferase [Candidatus Lokiarchaeota archaeon CR_4]
MVEERIISQIIDHFRFSRGDNRILGIILYGSYVSGDQTPRSDIDLCIVTREKNASQLYEILSFIWQNVPVTRYHYDVRMFHELPLYIQGTIIERGIVVYTQDEAELYEYLYPYRKRWTEQKFRQQLSPEEMEALF